LYLAAARELCPKVARREVCDLVGVHRNTLLGAAPRRQADLRLVARVLGDERFGPLRDRPVVFQQRG
jgi:hypothetical protein